MSSAFQFILPDPGSIDLDLGPICNLLSVSALLSFGLNIIGLYLFKMQFFITGTVEKMYILGLKMKDVHDSWSKQSRTTIEYYNLLRVYKISNLWVLFCPNYQPRVPNFRSTEFIWSLGIGMSKYTGATKCKIGHYSVSMVVIIYNILFHLGW